MAFSGTRPAPSPLTVKSTLPEGVEPRTRTVAVMIVRRPGETRAGDTLTSMFVGVSSDFVSPRRNQDRTGLPPADSAFEPSRSELESWGEYGCYGGGGGGC